MSFETFIGGRYLRTKQRHAFISLITLLSIAGVTVGVMTLIVVIAVMAGFEADLKSRILGVESHLEILRHGTPLTDYNDIISHAVTLKEVAGATPVITQQVMLRSAANVSGGMIKGIDPDSVGQVIDNLPGEILEKLKAGDEEKTEEKSENTNHIPGIILGKQLALNLGLVPGDQVYLISPRGMMSPIGHVPSMKRFRVTGRFESGVYDFDASLAFIKLSDAQRMFRMPGAVNAVEIKLNDVYAAQQVGDAIVSRFGFPYWSRTWMQMNRTLFSALKLEKTVMFIILTLIVLVAAFNIASSLIMMVMEKRKDIAILKAMGATDTSIRKIFVFKGMVIGMIGTVSGVALGLGLCMILNRYQFIELPPDVYYLTTIPVLLKPLDLFAIAAAALLICFIATLYPAGQAARIHPVEAMRYG